MSAPLLIHLPYSPWSERARWALDLRGVPYRSELYSPLLGEPRLARLRRASGRSGPATVPVLVTVDAVLCDSMDIARFADAQGAVGPRLFPEGRDEEVARWNGMADRALDAGRGLALRRTLGLPGALADLVPRKLRWLGPLGRATAAVGVRRTLRKYETGAASDDELRAKVDAALAELRAALEAAPRPARGPKTLLGEVSYADVTAAQALAFVSPARSGVKVKPATREAFTDPVLAERHADLLAWRDELYEACR